MAVMCVNTTRGNEEQLGNRMLRGFRARVDAFASGRMQHAVAEAERVRGLGRRPSESSLARAAGRAEAPGVELKPLDEEIISAAIPAFFIGRNKAGLWVAREATGRAGGIFLLKRSALAFARAKIESAQAALVFPSTTFELDLENEGNPFARHLESLSRFGRDVARCALTAVLALMVLAAVVALQAAIDVHVYLWRLVG
jgi:hypothetical protein